MVLLQLICHYHSDLAILMKQTFGQVCPTHLQELIIENKGVRRNRTEFVIEGWSAAFQAAADRRLTNGNGAVTQGFSKRAPWYPLNNNHRVGVLILNLLSAGVLNLVGFIFLPHSRAESKNFKLLGCDGTNYY